MIRPEVTLADPWHFPEPTITRLPSGLTVWRFDLPGQHIATFEVVVPAPLAAEPRGKEGVATVALHAIDEGTVSHPDGAIGELLEGHGATLHGSARHHYSTLGGQAPVRHLHDVLDLFVEVLREPAYADTDIAHQVEAQVASYESRLASPGAAARLALRRVLHGSGHRDGRPASGVPGTIAGITAPDASRWHGSFFRPDGATLLIAGDLPDSDVTAPFHAWGAGLRSSAEPVSLAPAQPPRVVVVDRPTAVQATVLAGVRSVGRSDPRWPALRLAGQAVAGAFASRLNLELRERLGYTYGIGGGFAPGPEASLFTVGGSVRTEVAADSVARILDGLRLADGFVQAEIDDARRYLVGVAPLANETSADIVAQASALAAAALRPDFMNRHFADLLTVTADDATDAFRTEVTPERTAVVVAGRADAVVPALEGLGLRPEVLDLRA